VAFALRVNAREEGGAGALVRGGLASNPAPSAFGVNAFIIMPFGV
jgi:hypothetical protein